MTRRVSTPSRRSLVAAAVIVMWLVGLGMLARRELFRPPLERLARAAMLVAPGATYYSVHDTMGRHVGFASSTIDTTERTILITDYLVTDFGAAGTARRTTVTTSVRLSRGLRMQSFSAILRDGHDPVDVSGEVESDSLMRLVVSRGGGSDTTLVSLAGPVLLPTLLPMAAVLAGEPAVGRRVEFPVFDPLTRAAGNVRLLVDAESLFVVHDSASFDSVAGRWVARLPDTLRAWHIRPADAVGFTGWVDEQGHVLRTTALGSLTLVRQPFELAWENWRLGSPRGIAETAPTESSLSESSPVALGLSPGPALAELVVRISGAQLDLFRTSTPRQSRRGDTIAVARPADGDTRPRYTLPMRAFNVYREFLGPEPLIDSEDQAIVQRARILAGGISDPLVAAERIFAWVRDSVSERSASGASAATEVLRSRSGDSDGQARLTVALLRAAGVPARLAEGLVMIGSSFHYHAWSEVRLGEWVGIDPALNRFPVDASYVRLSMGGRPATAAILRLIGGGQVEVLHQSR